MNLAVGMHLAGSPMASKSHHKLAVMVTFSPCVLMHMCDGNSKPHHLNEYTKGSEMCGNVERQEEPYEQQLFRQVASTLNVPVT